MIHTKERILQAAVDLFAEKGFDAVSMRAIAAVVGIKAASLYKHFASKQEILESIFDQFRDMIRRSNEVDEELLSLPDSLSPHEFLITSFQSFRALILSPQMSKITRIITMEQTRNSSVRDFFYAEMVSKPIVYFTETFTQLRAMGLIGDKDPSMLAKMYHAYIISLYYTNNFLVEDLNPDRVESDMLQFIEFFCDAVL